MSRGQERWPVRAARPKKPAAGLRRMNSSVTASDCSTARLRSQPDDPPRCQQIVKITPADPDAGLGRVPAKSTISSAWSGQPSIQGGRSIPPISDRGLARSDLVLSSSRGRADTRIKGRGHSHSAIRDLHSKRWQRSRSRSPDHFRGLLGIEDRSVAGTDKCVAILRPHVNRAALVGADAGIGHDAFR